MFQTLAEWLVQDVVAEFVAAGLKWRDSNCECGPSLGLEHFQTVEVGDSWKTHNKALEHFRDQFNARYKKYGIEHTPGYREYGLDHNSQSRYWIPDVVHRDGPNYKFDFTTMKEWNWHQMIAHLDADSMEFVVHGGDRSRGIVRCSLLAWGTPDLKTDRKIRNNMNGQAPETSEKTFDFAIWRSDGSCLTLQPEFKTTKVACTVGLPPPDHELPATGIGGTSGKTSFQHFIMKGGGQDFTI